MSISHYLKEIGRGARGARALSRAQAADLFAQVLDGQAGELEVGAFCIAMRIKGETPEELAGFLDATQARLARIPPTRAPLVLLPSYNGARKLPVLTPLLALLLARAGLPVLLHGHSTEARRVTSQQVLEAMGIVALSAPGPVAEGEVAHIDTALLCPGLARLLDARQRIGLRNPAHSVVKLMQPGAGLQLVIGSYTHPEYAQSMGRTLALTGASGLLSRGLEGESAADPRRTAQVDGFVRGERIELQAAAAGTLAEVPGLPADIDAAATASYTGRVLAGQAPVPEAIARQVEQIRALAARLAAQPLPVDPPGEALSP